MFGIEWLDIGLGMIFIYLLVALACTAVTDGIATLVGLRWKSLKWGILNILDDKGAVEKFYGFPLLKSYFEGKKPPSNIPAQVFSAFAFKEVFKDATPDLITQAKSMISGSEMPGTLKDNLSSILSTVDGKIENFRAAIEAWYDSAMENVSALYKRRTKLISIIVAVVVVGAADIDSVAISQFFSKNAAVRTALAKAAGDFASGNEASPNPGKPKEQITTLVNYLDGYGIPYGWKGNELDSIEKIIMKVVGLLMSAAGASLGAPFWFDMLGKISALKKSIVSTAKE